jgi:hypothetical protein
MRTLTEKYFGGLRLEKEEYEADLAVVDRYQSFSAELLRLSLLGIAGYGFLIVNVVLKTPSPTPPGVGLQHFSESGSVWALIVGATALGLAAATSLGHRYFATDCVTHFVRRVRAMKRRAALPEGDNERTTLIEIVRQEQRSLERDVGVCRWLLIGSSLFLVTGAVCVALSFAFTLFGARAT